MKQPIADKIPFELKAHNDTRIDDYYWLNQKENPKVIQYLEEENAYYKSQTKHTEDFQTRLFEEMKARIKEDDESLPYKKNGYNYITKFEKGKQYPQYFRTKDISKAQKELLVDVNLMAEGFNYYSLKGLSVSPNNRYLAFGVDTLSRRIYTIYIKDLKTGKILKDKIENTTGSAVWANDNVTLFYSNKDEETLRSFQIFKHKLKSKSILDTLVFEEEDETFDAFVSKTKSQKYIVIGSSSTLTTEYQLLDADTPDGALKIFQKRQRELEYAIEHYEDKFYILTNKDKAENYKIMVTPLDKTEMIHWKDLIAHRPDVLLEDFSVFKNFMIIEERCNGLLKIRIKSWDGSLDYYLPFDEETYTAYVAYNPEFDTNLIRYAYQSLTRPNSLTDFDVFTREKFLKKEQQVLGGVFKKENYISKRIWAPARDGKKVPVSLVYHKNTKLSKDTPLLLYAYGSYGHTVDDTFSTVRLSLLDRGFVFAIAHIRGGQYLGRQWYDNGKLLDKKNTFYDFIDAAKYLIAENYTSSNHLYAEGGSAGGLLMGAIVNYNPELFNGVIAAVPFVDVVTTMQDTSIPLTTGEFDEWGNPEEENMYTYIKSYSPYDNVKKQKYPNLYVTTGLHDSQVQYFEPAKWVAKLRDLKTDTNKLLFHIDMEVGHGGASGRFDSLKEVARDYSFLMDLEKIDC
ncbi:MAG: S9 family peptidase [Flavobacteriales bacterium]|jgi:oligopeptidase B|nr:S9 family peptidase [Flavobacteriales bacterium]